MIKILVSSLVLVFINTAFGASSTMCDVISEEGQISLIQAFAKLNKVLVTDHNVDLTFTGCKGNTTWGILEKNNFPRSFPDTKIVFMFFDGIKNNDGDKFEFKLSTADDPYRDGVAWVSMSTGEVTFP